MDVASSSRPARASLRIAARSSPRRQEEREQWTSDKSTSSGGAVPQQRLRLRRQPSNVEYDPENPFDDVQRDTSSSSSRQDDAKIVSARTARLSGHSDRSSRESSPLPVDSIEAKSRARQRPSALERASSVQTRARSAKGTRNVLTRESDALSSPPRTRRSPSRSPGAIDKVRSPDRRTVSPKGITLAPPEHHSLSKETMDALKNLEMMLEKLKIGPTGSKSQARTTVLGQTRSPPTASECQQALVSAEKRATRRTLSPSKQIESGGTDARRAASPSKSDFLRRVDQVSPARSTPKEEDKDFGAKVEEAARTEQKAYRISSRSKYLAAEDGKVRRSPRHQTRLRDASGVKEAGPPDQLEPALDARPLPRVRTADKSSTRRQDAQRSADDNGRPIPDKAVPRRHMRRDSMRGMTILLDVRDQNGDDASQEWQAKLESFCARVTCEPPGQHRRSARQRSDDMNTQAAKEGKVDCIVYRNGKPGTLRWYKAQVTQDAASAPAIVSVHWITASLEEGHAADVRNFLVEVGKQSLNKGRPSASPKASTSPSSDENADVSGTAPFSALVARRKSLTSAPDRPSPLARRCWNMDSSTSSVATNLTSTTNMSGAGL